MTPPLSPRPTGPGLVDGLGAAVFVLVIEALMANIGMTWRAAVPACGILLGISLTAVLFPNGSKTTVTATGLITMVVLQLWALVKIYETSPAAAVPWALDAVFVGSGVAFMAALITSISTMMSPAPRQESEARP